MASSSDFPDMNADLAPAEPTPSAPQTDPAVDSPVGTQDPIPDPSLPIPSVNVEPFDMQDVARTEMNVLNPLPISQHPPAIEAGSPRRRGRKRGGARVGGEFLLPEQFPDFVPKDWQVMKRARPTGTVVDTYYIEPSKNRQLRSKKQVLQFLANGGLQKNPKRVQKNSKRVQKKDSATKMLPSKSPELINSESMPEKVNPEPINSESMPEKPSKSPKPINSESNKSMPEKLSKRPEPINSESMPEKPSKSPEPINSESIPEKVRWVHTNSAGDGDLWTPFIGEERVPEHMRLEWKAKCDPRLPTNGGSTA